MNLDGLKLFQPMRDLSMQWSRAFNPVCELALRPAQLCKMILASSISIENLFSIFHGNTLAWIKPQGLTRFEAQIRNGAYYCITRQWNYTSPNDLFFANINLPWIYLILEILEKENARTKYDHLMSTSIFTFIMNKIFIWAPEIMRQMARPTIWIHHPFPVWCRPLTVSHKHPVSLLSSLSLNGEETQSPMITVFKKR